MPTTSKYFIVSTVSGKSNWIDFDLKLDPLTLLGQEIVFTGSNAIDAIRVGSGVILDFSKSQGGVDTLFLSGRLSDYTLTPAVSTVTLERGAGADYERIVVAKGASATFDNVVFSDGTATSLDLHAKASGTLGTITLTPVLSPPTSIGTTVKAFALDPTGEVFAPTQSGVNYIVTGGNGIDMVYVNEGATIDATKLNGGVDEIYLTGSWADYSKQDLGSRLVLSRAATGESVTVAVGTSALSDRLIFADGSVQIFNAKTALGTNGGVALSAMPGFDAAKTTPSAVPRITSLVDDVSNLDVTSPIVLRSSQSVTAVAGKFIRIMNDGGSGFRGEASDNDQVIDVGSSAVTVQGNLIIIRPPHDLDLANNYHLEIDADAFVNAAGRGSKAVSDPTAINFSTVVPGNGLQGVSSAVLSTSMDTSTGNRQDSFKWLDIEGVGSPNNSSGTVFNLSGANVALAFKDYVSAGGVLTGNLANDGIGAPDFYVRAASFGAGDLVYIDNQTPAQQNALSITTVLGDTPAAGITQVSFSGYYLSETQNSLNGLLEIALENSSAVFSDFDQLQSILGTVYRPFGEWGATTPSPAVSIQTVTSDPGSVAEGTQAVYAVSLSGPAPAGGFVVDWRILGGAMSSAQAQDFGIGASSVYPSGSITVAAGMLTGQISVPVFDDSLTEGAENFILQAGKLTSGTFTSAAERTSTISASDQPVADTTPPTLQSATVSTDGRTVTLTFSEALDAAAVNSTQLISRFSITAGQAANWPLEAAQVVGSTVVLTTPSSAPIPRPASLSPSTVSVSYADVSAANDTTGVVQDAAGNDVVTFSSQPVVNNSTYTPQPPTPTIQSLEATDNAVEGATVVYTVTLNMAAPTGGFLVDWRARADTTDPAQAQDLGTGASAFPTGSITIAAGQTSGQISLPVFDDTAAEGTERFVLEVGKLVSGVFNVARDWTTFISPSDSGGGGTTDDFCTINPATQYAGYLTAHTVGTTLPSGMSRHVSDPAQRDGVVTEVSSYGADYTTAVEGFVSAVAGLSTTTTFGFVLEDFETRAAGNFAGTGTGYTAAAGTSVTGQSGSVTAGDGSGTLVIDGRMAIKLFNIGSNVGTGGDSPGNDPGIATNMGNDADRGYNQTEDGNLYLEVLPADQRAGGVLVCFDEIDTAVYGFGFHLMGREESKRDVYLDVHFSDGSIYRELTGTNPLGTGGEQFYSYALAPSAGKTIEGFVLYESWAATDGAERRDIFAIDDLALVVADKTGSLTGAQYRDEILGRNTGGGEDTTPPVLTISSYDPKVLAGRYASIQFLFSEPVTGFDLSDVVVSGGVIEYFSGTGGIYYASFRPNANFDGTSTFTVAAGAFSDEAGNASTAAAMLSLPTFTVQPGNSGATTFSTNATTGKSDIVVRFSEAIYQDVAAAPLAGFSLALNPSADNGFNGVGSVQPEIVGWEYTPGGEGTAITLMTNAVFGATDVVRVSINGYHTSFSDADGNELAGQDIYIGGSGDNTINLDWYGASSRQILRGNGGNDMLIGTDGADSFVDGGGVDFIDPVGGGDSIALVENGLTGTGGIAYARDSIMIGLGDSRRGVGNTDVIRFDPAQSSSGFDWFSPNSANHDELQLESRVIAGASSFVGTPTAQGGITGHTISTGSGGAAGLGGIVTFRNSAGGEVAISQATNLGNALDYLRVNLRAPGHTVAFKADYDNNGAAESLFVYQDMGTLPLAGNAEMPDIVVRIELPAATAGTRLASVTLGQAPGANLLEIKDGFAPEPMAIDLAPNGVAMNFVEPVTASTSLAVTLQVNGTGPVYTPSVISGSGTAALLIQCATLADGTVSLQSNDWALVTYAGRTATNAFADLAGNALAATDDNGNPVTHAFVLGSSGNNVINLSARVVGDWGLDVEAGAGDDTIVGTSGADWIAAGAGVDVITGGGGGDGFLFVQGDSPLLTVNTSTATYPSLLTGATYTFAGGKAELIEDLGRGDVINFAPPFEGLTGGMWLSGGVDYSQGSSGTATGLVADQRFLGMGGTLGANGVFTVGDYNNSPDTLIVYDGDGTSGVSQTGFVLRGISVYDLEGLYGGSNTIRMWTLPPLNGTEGDDNLVDGSGADIVNGFGGNDSLDGRGGNDILDAGNGNDTLAGGAGNDSLEGGAGVDTAGFSGAFANYGVMIEADGIRITDTVAGRDGMDQVFDVERFVFSDGEYRVNAAGTGLALLSPQAAEVLDVVQESGYPQAQDAATYEFTPDNLADWLDGPAPVLVSQVATRSQASINGAIDDNELKYGLEFVPGTGGSTGMTTLFMRYDLDPLVGQVQASSLIELTFPGDVRTSLVPESLTFSG